MKAELVLEMSMTVSSRIVSFESGSVSVSSSCSLFGRERIRIPFDFLEVSFVMVEIFCSVVVNHSCDGHSMVMACKRRSSKFSLCPVTLRRNVENSRLDRNSTLTVQREGGRRTGISSCFLRSMYQLRVMLLDGFESGSCLQIIRIRISVSTSFEYFPVMSVDEVNSGAVKTVPVFSDLVEFGLRSFESVLSVKIIRVLFEMSSRCVVFGFDRSDLVVVMLEQVVSCCVTCEQSEPNQSAFDPTLVSNLREVKAASTYDVRGSLPE